MVAPTSGPFTWARDVRAPDWYGNPIRERFERNWMRQKKPYNLVLPYSFHHMEIVSIWDVNQPKLYNSAPSSDDQNYADAYNKAYAKFKDQIGDTSTWGVNLFEAKQSIGMIVKRATQLRKFVRKLNHFDFPGAARDLQMDFVPKGVRKSSKAFANNWLEYHFGWEPLVKDIGGAVDTLQKPFPKRKVTGTGKGDILGVSTFVNDYGPSEGKITGTTRTTGSTGVRLQAVASVSNPNLYLANQLGFTNPLSIAWELVPFSFVADWFVNVGDVLSSMTDFVGVSFENASTTTRSSMERTYSKIRSGAHDYPNGIMDAYSARSFFISRSTGLGAGPILSVKPFKGLSLVRGATAISLLVQSMRK